MPSEPRKRWGRGDLEPFGPPEMSLERWQDPAAALDALQTWAQERAVAAITWYLRDKQVKRWGSRLLRAAAVVLTVGGGLFPLLGGGSGDYANIGYVFLALAAGCVAFDHFFGLSSGWMRDILTAQDLQARLVRFQMNWANWQASEAGLLKPSPGADDTPGGGVRHALDLIDGLVTDVLWLTERETAQWIGDFNSSIGTLRQQANVAGIVTVAENQSSDFRQPRDPGQSRA